MTPPSKSVAIIGAGPAGLTTAKYFLSAGLHPIIFEAKSHVGGLWAPHDLAVDSTRLDPRMTTNVSKYACTFSDYFPESAKALPDRPVAREIGEYLEGYAREYIPNSVMRLSTPVTDVEKLENGWKVRYHQSGGEIRSEEFEFLVLATGVFSHPYSPTLVNTDQFAGKMIHVSEYDGEKLFSGSSTLHNIVVVGGELSGSEVSADVALRIASLPEAERKKVKLTQVFPRPPWILPKLLAMRDPHCKGAPRLLALDQVLFDSDTLVATPPDKSPVERNQRLHGALTALQGGDQGEISPALAVTPEWRNGGLSIGMSDSYVGFARSGAITTVLGRVMKVTGSNELEVASVKPGREPTILSDVDLVIFATGYTPWRVLSRIFSPEMMAAFGADSTCGSGVLTRALYKQTLHPALGPRGAFVGIQRRPYFAMFELQARWLAGIFNGQLAFPSSTDFEDVAKGESHLISIGKKEEAMLHASGGGDYVEFLRQIGQITGIDDIIADALTMKCSPKPWIPAHLPPFPNASSPRSLYSLAAQSTLEEHIFNDATAPSWLSRHIFSQLHGKWNLDRRIVSRLSGFPSGTFKGTAIFQPRLSTFSSPLIAGKSCSTGPSVLPPKNDRYTMGNEVTEYLYSESGTLTTETGFSFQGRRKYIYALDPGSGVLSAWFVKPSDGESVDYFFHRVEVGREPEKLDAMKWGPQEWGVERDGGVKAAAEHLCEKDWYWPGYRFEYDGSRLVKFWIRYRVLGPEKEYVAEGEYTRA